METKITIEAREVLMQLVELLNQLDYDTYTFAHPILSMGSIGAHTRHIIELFEQLNIGYVIGILNYDSRKREQRLEQDIDFSCERIAEIIQALERPNKQMLLKTLHSNSSNTIETNYNRELLYNIEHCIHHQAIIKIALLSLGIDTTQENFGVAKSTLANRKVCAQ